MTVKILGFGGSLRKGSYSKALLEEAANLLPEGAEMEIFDIAGIPIYNQDDEADIPDSVLRFKESIRRSDAILISTPEYNYSIPGFLKNAIDWASRPPKTNYFAGKALAIMSSSTGSLGGARAQYHLRQVAVYLDLHPVNKPEVLVSSAHSKFDENMHLKDEDTVKRIKALLEALVKLAEFSKQQREN